MAIDGAAAKAITATAARTAIRVLLIFETSFVESGDKRSS